MAAWGARSNWRSSSRPAPERSANPPIAQRSAELLSGLFFTRRFLSAVSVSSAPSHEFSGGADRAGRLGAIVPSIPQEILVASVGDQPEGIANLLLVEPAESA